MELSIIASIVGGIMFGHSVMSFALECNGFRDYRFYVAFAGFILCIFA